MCVGLYFLPKINKRLRNIPGRPVISNCGTPTERASEFLDYHLQPIMRTGRSYIRDTGHFLDKLKELGKIPENVLLVTADVASLYPSIPHEDGLRALNTKLEEREDKTVSSEGLVNLAEFVLKNYILNLIQRFIGKFPVQLWVLNLLLRMHVFLWIWWRQNF